MGLLGRFDVLQLLLLRGSDVVPLALGLLFEEFVEFGAGLSRLCIVALLFALATVLFQQAQEVEHFAVRCDVDHAARAPISVQLLLHHHVLLLGHHLLLMELAVKLLVLCAVLHDFVLDLLHQVQELIERDAATLARVQTLNKVSDFRSVPLQGPHDRLQVIDLDKACLLRVKHLEDATQVLNLVIGEGVQNLVVLMQLLLVVVHELVVGVVKGDGLLKCKINQFLT